jgi:transposase
LLGSPSRAPSKGGRTLGEGTIVYVGVDAAKDKHAVAAAESDPTGEVRYLGATPASVERFVRKLKYDCLHVCYEAGPTGYGLHRQITAMGHVCEVAAPSLVPKAS